MKRQSLQNPRILAGQPVRLIGPRRLGLILVAAFAVVLLPTTAAAQDDEFPEFRPSPKIELSESEAAALKPLGEPKKYLKRALELMETRILAAEGKNEAGEYDVMLAELGGFHAVIDVTLEFLSKNDNRRGRVLDTFKRYEMALRRFSPRIENIRRDAPEKYSMYVTKLLRRVRENRARAIEPFFGDSVIPSEEN